MTEAIDNKDKRQNVFSLFKEPASLESILEQFSQAADQEEQKHAEHLSKNLEAASRQPSLSLFSNANAKSKLAQTEQKPRPTLFSVKK